MRLDLDVVAPEKCGPRDLELEDARALAVQLERAALPYASLVTCQSAPKVSVVVFDAEVELPQHCVHDIRSLERIAVVFRPDDNKPPEVLALREDFPVVPHLNLRPWTCPKSLCLYDVPFRDIRAHWTPARFVARVREWLRLTARGELHGADQPLEALLGDSLGIIILPHALRSQAGPGVVPLVVEQLPDHRGSPVLIASLADKSSSTRAANGAPGVVATVIRATPREFAAMQHAPSTLGELQAVLAGEGDDLPAALRASLRQWELTPVVLDALFVLVILVPVRRTAHGPIETVHAWAFLTDTSIRSLGAALGIWELRSGVPGFLLSPDTARVGESVRLSLLSPVFTLSREDAARHNGRAGVSDLRITAIGGGALGSQVLLNSVRSAFGRWTVIDEDILLPHNLARHALPPVAVGWPKASSLAAVGNSVAEDSAVCASIVADVLEPRDQAEAVSGALQSADVILDLSASITVARALARDVASRARRVSIYLNPSGADLTLLAEDAGRAMPLDLLEMQYYRALVRRPEVSGALLGPTARIRYGRSCRDVSVQLPGALVALHGGIAARALEQTLTSPAARLRVWRVDDATFGVVSLDIEPSAAETCTIGDWTLVTDDSLLERLAALRAAKLPNETGGVLVGTFDLRRRILYVVDTVPSPLDSREWPTLYIRGCVGLEVEVRKIEAATAGQLHYIGEWHSHPGGHSCLPSQDDLQVFAWLTDKMDADGLPALMMIVGDGGLAVPYLGRMMRDGSYPAALTPASLERA